MRIEIEIPKEFEKHFNEDKFMDSFERIMADIKHSLDNGDCLCAGRYEYETIEMLEKAFKNSRQAYDIDKVVEELEDVAYVSEDVNSFVDLEDAIEIVKQGGVSDDVCEWHKVKNGNAYKCNTHAEIHDSRVLDWCKCPYCGKKIKVVE